MGWVDVEQTAVEPTSDGWVDVEAPTERTGSGTDEDPYVLGNMPLSEAAPETYAEDRKAEEADMSQSVAEVKQAITTVADQLGITDDSPKAMEKYRKEVTRVLNDKGFKVENRGGKLTAVDSYGEQIDVEEGMLDSLTASTGEMLGAVGAGMAGGAAGGTVAGPVGAVAGGILGGAAGAMAGDQIDVSLNADKHGITITPEERLDRAVEVGVTDAVAGAVGGAAIKGAGKLALASDTFVRNVIGFNARGANKPFTTVAEASAPIQKAIKNLQAKSGMSDELVEKTIKDYEATLDGTLSQGKAVEGLAKSAEKEQTGFAIAAMDDSVAKSGAIDEMTKRTQEIENAFAGDEELEALIKRHTVDDEGRRKATNWGKVKLGLDRMGFEEGDPIYDKVVKSAEAFGSKESDIFAATVKPDKGKPDITEALSTATETARGGAKSQIFATGVKMVDDLLTRTLPNADASTIKIIKDSMKNGTTVEKLSDELIQRGHDVQAARKAAREVIKLDAKEAEDAVQGLKDDIDLFKRDNKVPTELSKKLTWAKKNNDREMFESVQQEIKKANVDAQAQAIVKGVAEKTAKRQKRKSAISAGLEAKDRAGARATEDMEAEATQDIIERTAKEEAEQVAEATKKQKADDLVKQEKQDLADDVWANTNEVELKGKTTKLKKLRKDVKEAKDPKVKEARQQILDDFKKEIETTRKAREAKADGENPDASKPAPEATKPDPTAGDGNMPAMKKGIGTQTKVDFDEPVKEERNLFNLDKQDDTFDEGANLERVIKESEGKGSSSQKNYKKQEPKASTDKKGDVDNEKMNTDLKDLEDVEIKDAREKKMLDAEQAKVSDDMAKADQEAVDAKHDNLVNMPTMNFNAHGKTLKGKLANAKNLKDKQYRKSQVERFEKELQEYDAAKTARTDAMNKGLSKDLQSGFEKAKAEADKVIADEKAKLTPEVRKLVEDAEKQVDDGVLAKGVNGIAEKDRGSLERIVERGGKDGAKAEKMLEVLDPPPEGVNAGKFEKTIARDLAVVDDKKLFDRLDVYSTTKEEGKHTNSWAEHMEIDPNVTRTMAKNYYERHGSKPSKPTEAWINNGEPRKVDKDGNIIKEAKKRKSEAVREPGGKVKKTVREVITPKVEKVLDDATFREWNTKMGLHTDTKKAHTPLKDMFNQGKVTQAQIETIFKDSSVPYEIKRLSNWKKD